MLNQKRIHDLALNSKNKIKRRHPEYFDKFRMCMIAIIIKGNSVIATSSSNQDRKTYPFKFQNKYEQRHGYHAELNVINKCTSQQLRGSTIIVYGLTGGNNYPFSTKPCEHCLNAIKNVGIKKIIYFENGEQKKLMVASI